MLFCLKPLTRVFGFGCNINSVRNMTTKMAKRIEITCRQEKLPSVERSVVSRLRNSPLVEDSSRPVGWGIVVCSLSWILLNYHSLTDLVSMATDSLKAGNIIAVPTDTIYGVAGLAQRSDAIGSIYEIKNRDYSKPIAISVADIDDVYRWGSVTVCRDLLVELLPGPVTVVFERTDALSQCLNPGTSLIGIRIPDHTFIRELARSCQEPIALTSANISCTSSTVSVEEFRELWPLLDIVFDGGLLGNTQESRLGSTVVDLSVKGQYRIIRDGSALKSTTKVLEKYGLTNSSANRSIVDTTDGGEVSSGTAENKPITQHSKVKSTDGNTQITPSDDTSMDKNTQDFIQNGDIEGFGKSNN